MPWSQVSDRDFRFEGALKDWMQDLDTAYVVIFGDIRIDRFVCYALMTTALMDAARAVTKWEVTAGSNSRAEELRAFRTGSSLKMFPALEYLAEQMPPDFLKEQLVKLRPALESLGEIGVVRTQRRGASSPRFESALPPAAPWTSAWLQQPDRLKGKIVATLSLHSFAP